MTATTTTATTVTANWVELLQVPIFIEISLISLAPCSSSSERTYYVTPFIGRSTTSTITTVRAAKRIEAASSFDVVRNLSGGLRFEADEEV